MIFANLPVRITHWVVRNIYPDHANLVSLEDLRKFFAWANRVQRTRGLVYLADTLKGARLVVTRFLSGKTLKAYPGVAFTDSGLPKILPGRLREAIHRGNPRAVSLALTLLSLGRLIKGGKPVDLSPITDRTEVDLSRISKAQISLFIKA